MKCYWLGGLATFALLGLLADGHALQEKKQPVKKKPQAVFTDAAKAGIDYALQGEFAGTVGTKKFGAQVIALGNDKFEVNFLPGGLPGAGWDGKTRIKVNAKLDKMPSGAADQAKLEGGKWVGTLRTTGVATLEGKSDQGEVFSLKKVPAPEPDAQRTAAPQGNRSLQRQERRRVGGRQNRRRRFVADGHRDQEEVQGFCPAPGVSHALPADRAAKVRGNSGVYLQGRYEIQVLDSFGLKGLNNECGGLYSQTAPLVNMCYPPLAWQTYDINYQAARFDAQGKEIAPPKVTVLHNGVLIHNNLEIKGKHSNQPGPISLQNHGNPVYYRNIWIVPQEEG